MNLYSLKPTMGINYQEILSTEGNYYIWDMGGQAQYRSMHLEKLVDYLEDIDKVIYVIDIQDLDRYDAALEYLHEIVDLAGPKVDTFQLLVYLHKFDPGIETDLNNPLLESCEELIARVQEIAPTALIFKTSIYTVFRKIAAT